MYLLKFHIWWRWHSTGFYHLKSMIRFQCSNGKKTNETERKTRKEGKTNKVCQDAEQQMNVSSAVATWQMGAGAAHSGSPPPEGRVLCDLVIRAVAPCYWAGFLHNCSHVGFNGVCVCVCVCVCQCGSTVADTVEYLHFLRCWIHINIFLLLYPTP